MFPVLIIVFPFLVGAIAAFDSRPVCGSLQLTDTATSTPRAFVVYWTCRMTGVFPKFLCQFGYKKDNRNNNVIVPVSNVVSSDFTCTLMLPVKSLLPGKYTFDISMYPDLPNTSPSLGTSLESRELELALPVSTIEDACPKGNGSKDNFIRNGTTATCQCRLTDNGNPPGRAQWLLESNKTEVGEDQSDGTDTLTLSYDQQGTTNPVYICRGSSDLGKETIDDDNKYRPQFVYGPNTVAILMNGGKTSGAYPRFTFCEPTHAFDVYCDVAVDDVNPKPAVTLEGDAKTITAISLNGTEGNKYRYKFQVTPKAGGHLTMKCVASNPVFSDLRTDAEGTITVTAPPPAPPSITVDNGQSVQNGLITVTSGQVVVIRCRVEGGYPPVYRVFFHCPYPSYSRHRMESLIRVKIKKEMNRDRCMCRTDHPTPCYDHGIIIMALFNVQYAPELTEYNTNETGGDHVELNDGDTFNFSCEATGNPRPGLSIRGQRSNELLNILETRKRRYSIKGEINKVMKCRHTDTYTCHSLNTVGSDEKSVVVFVKCIPELLVPSDNDKTFFYLNGSDIAISMKIIGYPEPSGYSLFKLQNENSRRKRGVSRVRMEQNDYQVSYKPKDHTEGLVVLVMVGLVEIDSGGYLLTITNSIGHLDYHFSIEIMSAGSTVTCDQDLGAGFIVGISLTCVFIICVVFIVLAICLVRKRKQRVEKTAGPVVFLRPSPDYEDTSLPPREPLNEAYVDVDHKREARIQRGPALEHHVPRPTGEAETSSGHTCDYFSLGGFASPTAKTGSAGLKNQAHYELVVPIFGTDNEYENQYNDYEEADEARYNSSTNDYSNTPDAL